ncbi:MAG: HAD-IC family P-type ATPase, partial [Chlamydiota bacterium]
QSTLSKELKLQLTQKEAEHRLSAKDNHFLSARRRDSTLMLFLGQFKSPLILLLIFAAILAMFLSDGPDAAIILTIVFASALLTFFQEKGARNAVQKLLSLVKVKAQVLREGKALEIDIEKVVCGDIVLLSAGNIIPADCVILEARDCFADEATLTGESFHLEKREGVLPGNTPLAERSNMLFLGSHIVSGTAKAIVVRTGKETEFGKVAERLRFRPPETSFERGIRHLGFLLMEVTLLLVIAIFAFNVYLHRPVIESFLFAMALAVGLTPQLLPAIVGINLSHGARRMAKEKVIVKRLSSIENLGAMEILCADKTGTLTDGAIALSAVYDVEGKPSLTTRLHAHLNAHFQTGYVNPIDQAILAAGGALCTISEYSKRDEIPYDFIR